MSFLGVSFSPSMPVRSNGGEESSGISYSGRVRIGRSLRGSSCEVFVARSRNWGAWRRIEALVPLRRLTHAFTGSRGDRMKVVYPNRPRPNIVMM